MRNSIIFNNNKKSYFFHLLLLTLLLINTYKYDLYGQTTNQSTQKIFFSSNVKIENYHTQKLDIFNDKDSFKVSGVQGFCCDNDYFYIALLSYDVDSNYTKQETKILKFDATRKEIVNTKNVGKIGHSNTLTLKDNHIYTAPCTKYMPYVYEFDKNCNLIRKISLTSIIKGEKVKIKSFPIFAYNKNNDTFIVKSANNKISLFDNKFNYVGDTICSKSLKLEDNFTAQGISVNDNFIISVCNNLKKYPRVNYLNFYNLDGKFLDKLVFAKELIVNKGEKIEFEQITFFRNNYYIIANVFLGQERFFRIYKLTINRPT